MQSWLKHSVRPRPHAVHPGPRIERDPLLLSLWGPGPHGLGTHVHPIR